MTIQVGDYVKYNEGHKLIGPGEFQGHGRVVAVKQTLEVVMIDVGGWGSMYADINNCKKLGEWHK